MPSAERRLHARVSLDLPCALIGERRDEGRLRTLALHGAMVIAPPGAGRVSQRRTLEIDAPNGAGRFSLPADIVWLRETHAESTYGLRFPNLPDRDRETLALLLDAVLLLHGPGTRAHVRVSYRAQIRCRTVREFRAALSNLSLGGLAFSCGDPIRAGEEITVELRHSLDAPPIMLRGTVVHVKPEGQKFEVGARFEPLDPVLRTKVDELLRKAIRGDVP